MWAQSKGVRDKVHNIPRTTGVRQFRVKKNARSFIGTIYPKARQPLKK
jgi:hypothetical protein